MYVYMHTSIHTLIIQLLYIYFPDQSAPSWSRRRGSCSGSSHRPLPSVVVCVYVLYVAYVFVIVRTCVVWLCLWYCCKSCFAFMCSDLSSCFASQTSPQRSSPPRRSSRPVAYVIYYSIYMCM